ncbi:hypothetical protein [Amycolatopsis silviterrae]|uniref:Uncharacterized protein n=1 Tax=Amycolatopsis silviterrae TaxID=1656914 RepID=A0ABW5HFD2_9PSEU
MTAVLAAAESSAQGVPAGVLVLALVALIALVRVLRWIAGTAVRLASSVAAVSGLVVGACGVGGLATLTAVAMAASK